MHKNCTVGHSLCSSTALVSWFLPGPSRIHHGAKARRQLPCRVTDTISAIAPVSDRWSAAADTAQTQESGHEPVENKNASLALKRKRTLRSEGEGSIFILAWGTISFYGVSEYRMHCLISVPLQLSCPNSNLLWFMWPRSCFQWSHLTMKRVCVTLPGGQHPWQAAALCTQGNAASQSFHSMVPEVSMDAPQGGANQRKDLLPKWMENKQMWSSGVCPLTLHLFAGGFPTRVFS